MLIEYNDVLLQQAQIISLQRHSVWDDSHMHMLYVEWDIGVVAQYSPLGHPTSVAVKTLRPTPYPDAMYRPPAPAGGIASTIITGALATLNPMKFWRKLLTGKDALPSPVALRTTSADDVVPLVNAGTGAATGVLTDAARVRTTYYGPILTDITLRNRLMTQGKKLRIYGWDHHARGVTGLVDNEGKVLLLESPKGDYRTDPNLGPHPVALDIIDGSDNSFAVFFQIKTAVLPCEDNSDRLVLSHTWQASHTHDEDQYLTRVMDGEIVFNGSMITTLGVNIDNVRSQFFLPIPPGCYRTIEHVTPSTDGLTLNYRYSDHDQTIVFDAGDSGATRIDIAEKLGYYMPWEVNDVFPKFQPKTALRMISPITNIIPD